MRTESRPMWRKVIDRLTSAVDDHLPMSAEEREERDTAGLDGEEVARRRSLRFKLGQLEKRGKGGHR